MLRNLTIEEYRAERDAGQDEPGMNWTTPAEPADPGARLWDEGRICWRAMVSGRRLFPLAPALAAPGRPASCRSDSRGRAWIARAAAREEANAASAMMLEWRDQSPRQSGRNRIPADAWFDCAGRCAATHRQDRRGASVSSCSRPRDAEPAVPRCAVACAPAAARSWSCADDWDRAAGSVAWLQAHPRPGLYLRQVDIPGVDTKFIEDQRGLLAELLDLVLPARADRRIRPAARRNFRRALRLPRQAAARPLSPARPPRPAGARTDGYHRCPPSSFAGWSPPVRGCSSPRTRSTASLSRTAGQPW